MTSIPSYYTFLSNLFLHSNQAHRDVGLVTDLSLKRLGKAMNCSHNRSAYSQGYPCGICEVCRDRQISWQFQQVSKKTFSPLTHDYYSVILSLPKWPTGIPEFDGCKNFGELFFVTSHLFRTGRDVSLSQVLAGFRKSGMGAIQKCCPGLRLGMFSGLHLVNDWMMISPHLHVILCSTALDEKYWPLKMDEQGVFPELKQAWRSALGGRRGMSLREFNKQLLEHWADLLSTYSVQVFERYRAGFLPARFVTKNVAFRTFTGMTAADIEAMGPLIRKAVLSDPNCVHVLKIAVDPRSGEFDPVTGHKFAVKYALSRPFKHIDFRDLGGGMVSAQVMKDGKRRYVGDFQTLQRRMLQYFSVFRVRRYQAYGLFHTGRGMAKHAAFVRAMNEGYPR